MVSSRSKPELTASVLGITRKASANTRTPRRERPLTSFSYSRRALLKCTSNAPPPGTTFLSSRTFFTARSPSRTASLSCVMVWELGPLIRKVQLVGFFTPSMKKYLFSPRWCSYTCSAHPRSLSSSPSRELTELPPADFTIRSMFRRFARRNAMIPALASMSKDAGSMPFWFTTRKFLSGVSQTFSFNSMILRTRLSINARSPSAIFMRSSTLE
mmetsp:Transcript_11440/g.32129  ORF Transcript_11440/g.32129 Transcript_11440/m.32129 type:complete len:214 (-) Transcript_11440:1026-1667(-)